MEARQNPVSPLQTALWFGLPRTVAELGKPRERPNQSPSRRKSIKAQDLRRLRLRRRPDLATLLAPPPGRVFGGLWFIWGTGCRGSFVLVAC